MPNFAAKACGELSSVPSSLELATPGIYVQVALLPGHDLQGLLTS